MTPRERILAAGLRCVDDVGLSAFSLGLLADEAGIGRATVYRHFPGGRQEVISAMVTASVEQFWSELADDVRAYDSLEDRLVHGLGCARQRLSDHELLQRLLASEPDEVLPAIAESVSLVHGALHQYLVVMLRRENLREGVDVDAGAEYLARMLLSYIGSPGAWDVIDVDQARDLVRSQFLGGLIAG